MGTISQFFQPPLYWQQFEELCTGLLVETYDVPNAQQVGRPGQSQNGVDVYGKSARYGIIGIQCKRLAELDENNNPYPGGAISRAFLRKEAKAALAFNPELKLWILATTVRRDTRVQSWVDELNEDWEREQRDRIAIVWTWDECISALNNYPRLQRDYYRDVIGVRAPADLDKIILQTFAMAFQRPAFEMPLHCESPTEFLDALKDTQRAVRTGELVDRETRHVIRKAIGGYRELSDAAARTGMQVIDQNLRRLRSQLEQGLKDGAIRRTNGYLEIRDSVIADFLETLRQRCVDDMRHVLVAAGLPPI